MSWDPFRTGRSLCLVLAAFPLTLVTPSVAAGQTGVIDGRVIAREGRSPVAGATVRLRGASKATVTGERGRFTFARLQPGVYWLEIEALGYAPRSDSLFLAPDQTLEIDAVLTVDPVALPELEVTARSGPIAAWLASKGVPQRSETGDAMLHATQRGLAIQGVRDVAEAVRRVPGVRIRQLVNFGSELLLEPSPLPDGAPCPVEIYLNGIVMGLGRLSEVNFRGQPSRASRPLRFEDLVPIEEVDAVELYGPEESPVASESACGVLLIWSAGNRQQWDQDFVGIISGTVVDASTGRPLKDVRVSVQPGGISVTSNEQGEFEVGHLIPGDYVLRVEHADAAPWEAVVNVKANGIVSVELQIEGRSKL